MSVLVFISTPQNEYEKAFAVPVATEKFFYEINELLKVKEWACHNLFEGNQAHILERIELLLRKLPEAFRREDAVLYIG
jgi:hypothetical protein